MSYIRLHDPPTTQYPPSNFPSSKSSSLLMRLPQFGPREIRGAKVSSERKRKLVLSYLPDWSVIPPVCVDSPHTNTTQAHLYWTCVRLTLISSRNVLVDPSPQRRILRFRQYLWLQASFLPRRYLVSLAATLAAKTSPNVRPNSLRHP